MSSPGDVVEERELARRVIGSLRPRYPDVRLEAVLWEDLALPATASFQESIDLLLERRPVHVAIFIVWSRLGTPLRASGSASRDREYASGTEREFDLMLAAYERSGGTRPIVLVYHRDDDAGFRRRLAQCPSGELEETLRQQRAASDFVRTRFYDEQGRNVRACQPYRDCVAFAQRLHAHLRQALDDLVQIDDAATWHAEPYRGLEVFDRCHAAIFRGRDEEICEALERLRDQQARGCAFLAIIGPSGAGKSSLVRAGIADRLTNYAYDDSCEWRFAMQVPSLMPGGPHAQLAAALAGALPELSADPEDLAAGLRRDPGTTIRLAIGPALRRAEERRGGIVRTLLALDPMEELWTDSRVKSEERDAYFTALEILARDGRFAIVATLRSDFYGHAASSPAFLRMKDERGHFDLQTLSSSSLRKAIVEPARAAGIEFERHPRTGTSLDERILREAAGDPDILPMLQFSLDELYRRRDVGRRLLTFDAYESIGGVAGAIATRAESAFSNLPESVQGAFDEILPFLIALDAEGVAVRRPAAMKELTATPERSALVASLTASRLLTCGRLGDDPIATLAHESLLVRWERIARWLEVNRERLRRRTLVERARTSWELRGRDDSMLLAEGLPLAEGVDLLKTAPHLLNADAKDFVMLSIRRAEGRVRARRVRRLAFVGALALLAVVATGAAVVAWFERNDAVEGVGLAHGALESAELERERLQKDLANAEWSDYVHRLAAARFALKNGSAREAREYLDGTSESLRGWEYDYLRSQLAVGGTPLEAEGAGSSAVAFSFDGSSVAAGRWDGSLAIWNASTQEKLLDRPIGTAAILDVAFAADGSRLAATTSDGEVFLIDASTGEATPFSAARAFQCGALSPDGARLALGSRNGEAAVFDATDGREIWSKAGHDNEIVNVAFAEDGARLLSASLDGFAKVWDASNGAELARFGNGKIAIHDAAWSPDETVVATAEEMSVAVWSAKTGKLLRRLPGHEETVYSLAFSRDGTTLVSAGADEQIRVWDFEEGRAEIRAVGFREQPLQVAVSPDGERIVSAGGDEPAAFWNLAESLSNDLRCNGEPVLDLAIWPGATTPLAVLDSRGLGVVDGILSRAGDRDCGSRSEPLEAFRAVIGQEPRCIAFSPDGARLACGRGDRSLVLGDASAVLATLKTGAAVVETLAWRRDDRLVAGDAEGRVIVFEPGTGVEVRRWMTPVGKIGALDCSPDGASIVTASDRSLFLWDAPSGELKAKFQSREAVTGVAFAPDGKRFASIGSEGDICLWNPLRQEPALTVRAHERPTRVTFDDDGTTLIYADDEGTIRAVRAN